MSVASGGSCGSGAAAAPSVGGNPLVNAAFPDAHTDAGDLFGGTAAHAAIGGLAGVAGGGKSENGAATAAYGYLFNYLLYKDAVRDLLGWRGDIIRLPSSGRMSTPDLSVKMRWGCCPRARFARPAFTVMKMRKSTLKAGAPRACGKAGLAATTGSRRSATGKPDMSRAWSRLTSEWLPPGSRRPKKTWAGAKF